MKAEKQFETRIKKYIREKGGFCVKYFGCAYTTAGIPDLICTIRGFSLWIEVKAQNGKPSDLQLAKIAEIRKAGGLAFVVYPSGWEQLKIIIDDLFMEKFNLEEKVILK